LIILKKKLANEYIKNMFPEIDKALTLNAKRKVRIKEKNNHT